MIAYDLKQRVMNDTIEKQSPESTFFNVSKCKSKRGNYSSKLNHSTEGTC